ncbi:hypothetical protein Tco_0300668 [Tanacetum coccineum]
MFSLMKAGEEVVWATRLVQRDLLVDQFPCLPTPPFGLLPLPVASQPYLCFLHDQAYWDAGPTDGANVEANLRGDSGPDTSFDISASREYVSGLGRASPAKVISHVSPSEIPGKTIPHQCSNNSSLLVIV